MNDNQKNDNANTAYRMAGDSVREQMNALHELIAIREAAMRACPPSLADAGHLLQLAADLRAAYKKFDC